MDPERVNMEDDPEAPVEETPAEPSTESGDVVEGDKHVHQDGDAGDGE